MNDVKHCVVTNIQTRHVNRVLAHYVHVQRRLATSGVALDDFLAGAPAVSDYILLPTMGGGAITNAERKARRGAVEGEA